MVMINKISKDEDYVDPRREFLVRALTAGLYIAGGTMGLLKPAAASIWGNRPHRMPPNRSIYDMRGEVWVNGNPADYTTAIKVNDLVKTGASGKVIFVVGKDAFILRNNSQLQLRGEGFLINSMRLLTGKLLSVFGKRTANEQKHLLHTTTATIGIRGTGVYVESEPDQSYLCNCYGTLDVAATGDDPNNKIQLVSSYHASPKYILAQSSASTRIVSAPLINHTDLELMLVEELVGRKPPFQIDGTQYQAPRRNY